MKLASTFLSLLLWYLSLGLSAPTNAYEIIDVFHGDLAAGECYSVERNLSSFVDPVGCVVTNIVYTYFNGGNETGTPRVDYLTVQADVMHDCFDTSIKNTCLVYADGHGMCNRCSYHDDMLTLDDCRNLPGVFQRGEHSVSFFSNPQTGDEPCDTDFFPLAPDDTKCDHPALAPRGPTTTESPVPQSMPPTSSQIPASDIPTSSPIPNSLAPTTSLATSDTPTLEMSATGVPSLDFGTSIPSGEVSATNTPSDESSLTDVPSHGFDTSTPSGEDSASITPSLTLIPKTDAPTLESSFTEVPSLDHDTSSPSDQDSASFTPSTESSLTEVPSLDHDTLAPSGEDSTTGTIPPSMTSTAAPTSDHAPTPAIIALTSVPTDSGSSTPSPSIMATSSPTESSSVPGSTNGSSLSPRTGTPSNGTSTQNCLDDWANGVAEEDNCFAVDRFVCTEVKDDGCTSISALYHYYNEDMGSSNLESYYHITVHSFFGCSASMPDEPSNGCSVLVEGHECRTCVNNKDENLLVDCSNLGFIFSRTIQSVSLREDGGHLDIAQTDAMCNFGASA
ncbi:Mediates binding to human platelets, possibly through a receptor-ligand interaction. Probably associated with virulence in endovascular infection (By similarity) [Seminavis robusta]|uniref:Mediates binding to human platelets, possibly through a receptor-ligand interaction. Probably associated with virulence in endovascular infection By similarity n=1 Tax=Seminavis robusta TaxID=568900 RepID=A0A9N8DCI8_9STRA|nr:Mediates binding to human platelets, possibly through a receptor-ligand interaction. Probably associated with virulence in endovascular infection (By similarity) [Seminavis robusta]|eukprot:Sro34_g022020.1 Mediates binding to human platelets, possibly through a receptor-ligand interaction. Probably associated with virulence in endovascular infection (By similarity) (562) ;mRNA; f:86536-88312